MLLLLLLLLLLRLLLLAQVCCAALELMRPIGSGVKLPGAPTVASEPPPAAAAAAAGPSLLLLLLLVPLPLSQLLRPLLAPPAVFLRFRGEASGPKISPQPLFPSKAPRGARRNGASWVVGIVCRASFDFFVLSKARASGCCGSALGDAQRTIWHMCRWQGRLAAALLRRLGESFGRRRLNM